MRDQPQYGKRSLGEAKLIAEHSENWRTGKVNLPRINASAKGKKSKQKTAWKEMYTLVTDRPGLQKLYQQRRELSIGMLADSYQKGRCAALRMYICVAMEGHGKSPWRKWDGHTPDPDGERIMIDLATDSSIRYADAVSIDVRNSHIKQFHADNGFAPPPMPALTHMIGKLRTLVRFECDSGRAEQGAWTPAMMDKHFGQIDD